MVLAFYGLTTAERYLRPILEFLGNRLATVKLVLALLMLFISGCNTTAVAPGMPDHATINKDEKGNVYLDALSYSLPAEATVSTIKKCAAIHLDNDDIDTRSTTSYVGSYTGNLYQFTERGKIDNNETLLYAEEDTVVLNGRLTYLDSSGVTSARVATQYRLIIETKSNSTELLFSRLETMFQDHSALNNDFFRPGAWEAAKPLKHVKHFDQLAEQLMSCIYERS